MASSRLADRAQSVTPVGLADAVAPGAAGTLWLTSYPPGADPRTAAGTAREVSIAGAPLGPQLRIPAGYLIEQATDRGLLLAPVAPRPGTMAYRLWDPGAGPLHRRPRRDRIARPPRSQLPMTAKLGQHSERPLCPAGQRAGRSGFLHWLRTLTASSQHVAWPGWCDCQTPRLLFAAASKARNGSSRLASRPARSPALPTDTLRGG